MENKELEQLFDDNADCLSSFNDETVYTMTKEKFVEIVSSRLKRVVNRLR